MFHPFLVGKHLHLITQPLCNLCILECKLLTLNIMSFSWISDLSQDIKSISLRLVSLWDLDLVGLSGLEEHLSLLIFDSSHHRNLP